MTSQVLNNITLYNNFIFPRARLPRLNFKFKRLMCSGSSTKKKQSGYIRKKNKQDENDATLIEQRKNVARFFDQSPEMQAVKAKMPERFINIKNAQANTLYLVDRSVAERAATAILPHVQNLKEHIVSESTPGLGLISTELLKRDVSFMRLYEPNNEFYEQLEQLQKDFPNRVQLIKKSFFLLSQYELFDKHLGGHRVEEIFKAVPKKAWTDDPVMSVIGAMPNITHMRYFISCYFKQKYLFAFGRLQFFLFLVPGDFLFLSALPKNKHYKKWSILFHLLFDFEILGKFPRNTFFPWMRERPKQVLTYKSFEIDQMYLVRIVTKKDVPTKNLSEFFVFITNYYNNVNIYVIPSMEQLITGIGLRLLLPEKEREDYYKDLNILTKFKDLTPKQALYIFEELVSHPRYNKDLLIDHTKRRRKSENLEETLAPEQIILDEIERKFDSKI